jgi:hypothetical protein
MSSSCYLYFGCFRQLLGQTLVNVDLDHLDSLDPELYKNLLYLKVKYHTHSTYQCCGTETIYSGAGSDFGKSFGFGSVFQINCF